MLSTQDAFRKFRSRLELNRKEQEDASRRQKEVREVMDAAFEIEHDFLTGSYARWTKTKPLKDVDIFCVLAKKHRHYRDQAPSVLLGDVEKALVKRYGGAHVSQQRRSCTVDFGVTAVEDRTDYKVMSVDVVPAFTKASHYEDSRYDDVWLDGNEPKNSLRQGGRSSTGLQRRMEGSRSDDEKVEQPARQADHAVLPHRGHGARHSEAQAGGGDYRREMQAFFATLADRIHETWQDPPAWVLPSATPWILRQSRTHNKHFAPQNTRQQMRYVWSETESMATRYTRGEPARAIIPALVVDLKVCIDHVYTSRTGLNVFVSRTA